MQCSSPYIHNTPPSHTPYSPSQLIQYLKPRPEELFYPDYEGNIAVHYAARSSAADKTEILRYLGFVGEPAYLKESDAQVG